MTTIVAESAVFIADDKFTNVVTVVVKFKDRFKFNDFVKNDTPRGGLGIISQDKTSVPISHVQLIDVVIMLYFQFMFLTPYWVTSYHWV